MKPWIPIYKITELISGRYTGCRMCASNEGVGRTNGKDYIRCNYHGLIQERRACGDFGDKMMAFVPITTNRSVTLEDNTAIGINGKNRQAYLFILDK